MIKKKDTRNNQIYLSDYFTGRIAKSFDLERDKDILHWDFSTDTSETVKKQVEWILGYIVKNIKDSEARRNQYLFPLKFLFQYAEEAKITDVLLMETAQVKKYSARLISKTGKLCGSPGKFVEFCRRELFLAEKPQSCNNKIQGTIKFIAYLQVKDLICYFKIPVIHFLKKSYPARNEIEGIDEKLGLLEDNLHLFPEDLRVMSVILDRQCHRLRYVVCGSAGATPPVPGICPRSQ